MIGADDKAEIRPYMIWKIEDKNVYAFPVSMKTAGHASNRFYAHKYPNFAFDRRIKDSVVCLQKEDINKVIDRIHDDDYNLALKDVYQKNCKSSQEKSKFTKKFLRDMLNDIIVEPNDVLVCYRPHQKERDYYFVSNIEDDYYDVFKLGINEFYQYKIVGNEKLLKSRYICYVKKLTDNQIESINNQIEKQHVFSKTI